MGVETLGPFPEPQEHLLGYLLGPSAVTDEAAGERQHRTAVTSDDLGHRGVIAAGDRGDELVVIDLAEIFSRHSSTWPGRKGTKLCRSPNSAAIPRAGLG